MSIFLRVKQFLKIFIFIIVMDKKPIVLQPNSAIPQQNVNLLSQNRPPSISLYDIVMRFKNQLPPNDVSLYVNKLFVSQIIKSNTDGLFFAYALYSLFFSNKKWYRLTVTPPMMATRLLFGFFAPQIIVRLITTQTNQNFYKKYQYFFESNLTKQQIRMIDLNKM